MGNRFSRDLADYGCTSDSMPAKTGDTEQSLQPRVGSNDEVLIRGKCAQSSPRARHPGGRQCRQPSRSLGGDALDLLWIGQFAALSLHRYGIAAAHQQAAALRAKIKLVAQDPDNRPVSIDLGKRFGDQQVSAIGDQG